MKECVPFEYTFLVKLTGFVKLSILRNEIWYSPSYYITGLECGFDSPFNNKASDGEELLCFVKNNREKAESQIQFLHQNDVS